MENYKVVGVMSGTSLDGLDLALCEFNKINNEWVYDILKCTTILYSHEWISSLQNARKLSVPDFIELHNEYGRFIGKSVNKFLSKNNHADLIASHGHTIFHEPGKGITFQLGSGACIAAETKVTTISDFRTLDVALGGQGAPLVPIGDDLLFAEFDYVLNIGGFANVSFLKEGKRRAFDICPVNIIINQLAGALGYTFDKGGGLAREGYILQSLLHDLNNIEYYRLSPPKSMGREWLEKNMLPLVNKNVDCIENKLRTIYEHLVMQISRAIEPDPSKKILITGGGAHNSFLIELLANKLKVQIIVPDKTLVDFKEALIFALLGVLKMRDEINCLASVTGARENSSCGVIYKII